MEQTAVLALVGSISGLAVQETSLPCGVKDDVVFLKEELARLQGLLQDLHDKPRPGHAISTMATSVRQIEDSIEDAENVIEDCEYMEKRNRLYKGFMRATRCAVLPCDVTTLHEVGFEVRPIRRKIFGIKDHMHSISSSIVGVDGLLDMLTVESAESSSPP
ncbi:putative disease resistance protein At1g50180 [Aegilops tauschii subsp. strangulata]|uniref:putative disease resistance protein At1g50180 n=1 Tax=Aegilops tauschii subsp. strangulata TaxID=200361 RepID=UPI001ABC5EF3|nr:uncharacterized protein LOC120973478 [Aegilops tauschii subsp. strangulata]